MTALPLPFRRLLRSLALWLVVLALPWHGVAAATMPHAAAPVESTAEAPCHGSDPSARTAAKSTTCAACSACCVLASMPSSPVAAAPRVFAGRVVDRATLPRVAFLTDGPLRPPRLAVA